MNRIQRAALLALFLPLSCLAQSGGNALDRDPEALKRFLAAPDTKVGRDPHGDFGDSTDYLQTGSRVVIPGGFACVYPAAKDAAERPGRTKQTYASNDVQCRKYIVEGVARTGDDAVPQVPKSSYAHSCGASLRPDNTRATSCFFAASGEDQGLYFRANFKNAEAGASASVQAVLDGKDVPCEAGSVPQLTGTGKDPAIYCRVALKGPASSMHEVVFKSQWSGTALDKTAFAIQ